MIGTPLLTSLLLPLGVYAVISIGGPELQQNLIAPSCDDPRGLHAIASAHESVRTPDPKTPTYARNPDGSVKVENGEKVVRYSYQAENMVDGDSRTAWIEGNDRHTHPSTDPEGLGIGTTIDVTFDAPVDLRMVCIQNGWTISQTAFRINGRVRLMKLVTDAGTTVDGLSDKSLDRFTAYQDLQVKPGTTRSARFTITSVYAPYGIEPGEIDGEDDTAISGIEFWAQ